MGKEQVEAKEVEFWKSYNDVKTEEEGINAITEWLNYGIGLENYDEKAAWADETYKKFIRTRNDVAFTEFRKAVRSLSFENGLAVIDTLSANEGFAGRHLVEEKLDLLNYSEGNVQNMELVNKYVDEFLRDRNSRAGRFFSRVKNLSISDRAGINKRLSGKDLGDLNPEFHDLNTIGKMFNSIKSKEIDSKQLKSVLEYYIGDEKGSKYYKLMGSGIGALPETETAKFDKIMERMSDKPDEKVVAEIRKHFAMKDVLGGKGDKLDVATIASVLNEGDKITLLDKLSVEKLSDIYYGKSFDFNSHQKLLAVSKLLKVSGKDEDYYRNLMEDGKYALINAPHSHEAELFTDAAKGFADGYGASRLVAEAKNKINQKNSLEQDLSGIDKKRYAYEQGIDTLTKVQDIWSKIQENTAEGQEGISKAEVLQVIAKAVENGENVDGSLKLAVPKTKLPLLFGRKEAEKKQKDLESAVEALNKTLSNPKAMQNLKDLGVENALDKMVLSRLDNHVKTEKLKREQLVESYRGIGDLLSETYVVNKAEQFADMKNDIEETKGKGEKAFVTKVKTLRGMATDNVKDAAEDRGKKRSERAQPPKTAEEKKQAALAAYARRKEAIASANI